MSCGSPPKPRLAVFGLHTSHEARRLVGAGVHGVQRSHEHREQRGVERLAVQREVHFGELVCRRHTV